MTDDPLLGIVIPTLNEAGHLPGLLADLNELSLPRRVVVVDGGSSDGTPDLARLHGAEVRFARRGRASQLNAGAAILHSRWLLFLHADVRVPRESRWVLEDWLEAADGHEAATFRFRLAGDHWWWRVIEAGQRLRERISGLAYGDQGLLVRRETFRAVGGYPQLPVMEDVEIVRSLRRRQRVHRLPAALVSSPRRYEREGPWTAPLRNLVLITLHLAGVSPERLARWYRPDSATDGFSRPTGSTAVAGERTLLVFAKAPVEGEVKTRLARAVGSRRAANVYRDVGRRVVDQLRGGGGYRTVLCYDPPSAGETVRAWLGPEGLEFRPQRRGDLGTRMTAAFARAFEDAERVCIVGTDAPGVRGDLVDEAFAALDEADVVLGPATDGGYYLLALDRPRPELLRDVPWSTPDVLRATLDRIARGDLRVHLLPSLTDIDTVDDLETVGWPEH